MAVEIITSYPIPPWRQPMDSYTDNTLTLVLGRLGAIEDRLSRIEQYLTKLQPSE